MQSKSNKQAYLFGTGRSAAPAAAAGTTARRLNLPLKSMAGPSFKRLRELPARCTYFLLLIFIQSVSLAQSAEPVHLNRYEHFTQVMRSAGIHAEFTHFESKFDGSMQNVLILKPAQKIPTKLFFFFHGMDGDAGDAVVVRDLVEKLNGMVVAIGGRGPSWVSDAFLADATQMIEASSQDFDGYYLAGISMGGSQALALSGLLPEKMAKKLKGVIAIMPGTDLVIMLRDSSSETVRKTLMEAAKGDSEVLYLRSPIHLINSMPPHIPFVVVYHKEDKIVIPGTAETFISALKGKGHTVQALELPGDHLYDDTKINYQSLFESLQQGPNG